MELAGVLIRGAIALCRHAARYGGYIAWKWPPNNSLWHRKDVVDMLRDIGAESEDASTAALGMSFKVKRDGEEVVAYLKKKWRIKSNHTEFLEKLKPADMFQTFQETVSSSAEARSLKTAPITRQSSLESSGAPLEFRQTLITNTKKMAPSPHDGRAMLPDLST